MKCTTADPPADFVFNAMISCAIIVFSLPLQFILAWIFDSILFFKPDWNALTLCGPYRTDRVENEIEEMKKTVNLTSAQSFEVLVEKVPLGLGLTWTPDEIGSPQITDISPGNQILKITGATSTAGCDGDCAPTLRPDEQNWQKGGEEINGQDKTVSGLTVNQEVDFLFEGAQALVGSSAQVSDSHTVNLCCGTKANQVPTDELKRVSAMRLQLAYSPKGSINSVIVVVVIVVCLLN